MYKVGIVGCGAIFQRHYESIEANDNFKLVSICDVDEEKTKKICNEVCVPSYTDYKEMILKEDVNFIVVATPNSQHYDQCKFSLENNCDVLVEKPATLNPENLEDLIKIAEDKDQKIYAVLQVRLNPTVRTLKNVIQSNILGNIRGISLTQRWQRPKEYFVGWRGEPFVGGGTLHECGIHYLDILCFLFGRPDIKASSLYNTKHKDADIEDTIYSLLDFEDFGGTLEVTIASEPSNIECSLSILSEKGYIKVGGSALNEFVDVKFSDTETKEKYESLVENTAQVRNPNAYSNYKGSCPNHPDLYRNLNDFRLQESRNVIQIIDEIYEAAGVKYYE